MIGQNMNPHYNQANTQSDLNEYDSLAKTITHRESEFPLILNKNQNNNNFINFKNTASIIEMEVIPRDKSLKQQDKLSVTQKMKEYLLERIKIYVYPNSDNSIYVGFKLYNIDEPIKFNGNVEQITDNQDQTNTTKWVSELGYQLTYIPYNPKQKYSNLKNECLFSFLYECSVAVCTITVLVVRIADDKQIVIL